MSDFLFIIKKNIGKVLIALGVVIVILLVLFTNNSTSDNSTITIEEDSTLKTIYDEVENVEYIKVYIIGEVNNPGIYEVEKGCILNEAISLCGGLNSNASSNINLVYILNENVTIYIKDKNDLYGVDIIEDIGDGEVITSSSGLMGQKININTASLIQLCELPGVGDATAQNIINNRPYIVIEDLMKVPGIKENKFASLKEYISVLSN